MEMTINSHANLVESVQACILIVRNYRRKGYLGATTLRTSLLVAKYLYSFLCKMFLYRDSRKGCMFIAKENNHVVGTLSVDFNPTKLPIDKMFPKEMKSLYRTASFVYIGSFAVDATYNCTRLSFRILKEVWTLVTNRGYNQVICVINPDHCKFYSRFGFRTIAIKENMSGLSSAPAALMAINLHEVRL